MLQLAFYVHTPPIYRFRRWSATQIVRCFADNNGTGFARNITHVELIFSDGISLSSSSFDGGVRFKWIDYNKHPERWRVFKVNGLDLSPVEEQELKNRMQDYVGCKYDFAGVIFYYGLKIKNPKFQNDNKWWCSELVSLAIEIQNFRLSPYELYVLNNRR